MKIERNTRVLLPIGASIYETKPMGTDFWITHWDGPEVSRLKSWKIRSNFDSCIMSDTPNVSGPRKNGKFRTVTYAERVLGFRCFATVLTSKTVSWAWGRHHGKYTLQTGYVWKIDSLGLRIERLEDKGHYHPNGREFVEKNTSQYRLEDRCVRPEPKFHSKYPTKKLSTQYRGLMVTIGDSVNGGNCRGGTETFVQRLPESVRSKGEILSQNLLKYVQNPSEFGFVMRSIYAAKKRVQKLFSELSGNPVQVG